MSPAQEPKEGGEEMRTTQLSRAEADALVQAMRKMPPGFERDDIESILRRAEVPKALSKKNQPSAYDRWK
jgi:hypothetical protein